MKKTIILIVAILLLFTALAVFHKVRHPNKTESEVFLDIFKGEAFKKTDKK